MSAPWQRALSSAAEHADLGETLPHNTRMRYLKRLVLRAARVFTHHQVAFNRELLVAVQGLTDSVNRLENLLHRVYEDRQDDVASTRSDLVEIQQQLVEMGGGSSAATSGQVQVACDQMEQQYIGRSAGEGVGISRVGQSLGVNLFGDWAATTGLAQAARRLAVALCNAGLNLSLDTVHSGAPLDESRVPIALRDLPSDRSHSVDLWMLNINEFHAIRDEVLRPPGRKTFAIGIWYWELPTFPAQFIPEMNRVDEIWVATKFVQTSFQRATNRPVHIIPAIVPDLKSSERTRKDFGLMDDEVVFLFSFDVNSAVSRKNPGAVVDAFARAFPSPSQSRTRLVIKVLNLDRHPDVAQWLKPLVRAVNGVLIAEDLGHTELVDLFMCCDAYVSLHRSEGFGFGIAEAMALGKPVIATAYSGNLDFATMANSCQVSYRLREISYEDHVFNEGISQVYQRGAVWADPDIGQAARWMQLIAASSRFRTRVGEAGRITVREKYSAQAAVHAVENRLLEISADIIESKGFHR
jgi:glycosyltransferase involved in cell wall biosynthesis